MSAPPVKLTDEVYAEIKERVTRALSEADDDEFVVRGVISSYLREHHPEIPETELRSATFALLGAWARRTIMSLSDTGIRYDH